MGFKSVLTMHLIPYVSDLKSLSNSIFLNIPKGPFRKISSLIFLYPSSVEQRKSISSEILNSSFKKEIAVPPPKKQSESFRRSGSRSCLFLGDERAYSPWPTIIFPCP